MKIYFFLCKIRFSDLILHLVIPVLLQFIFMSERMVVDVVRGGQFIIVGRAPPFFFFDTGILKSSTPSTILVVMIMIAIMMRRIIDHDHYVLMIMRMKRMTVKVSVKLWGGLHLTDEFSEKFQKGGGNFQSKNLCHRFWTLEEVFEHILF